MRGISGIYCPNSSTDTDENGIVPVQLFVHVLG